MHCRTDTHTQTDRWLPGNFDRYRPLSLYRQQRGLKMYEMLLTRVLITQAVLLLNRQTNKQTDRQTDRRN